MFGPDSQVFLNGDEETRPSPRWPGPQTLPA